MTIASAPLWPTNVADAIAVQNTLRGAVITEDRLGAVQHVAGLDVGFEQQNTVVRAAIAVLDFPALELKDYAIARLPVTFPYIPGLLSFREIPALLEAFKLIKIMPDLLLVDGQGIAHPRRIGIASHFGVLTDMPSIGVAKSILVGKHVDLPVQRGAWQPLLHRGEVIGAALRTRANVSPVYISSGHRVSLPTAIRYVMACTTKYRLPETTRHAHRLASVLK